MHIGFFILFTDCSLKCLICFVCILLYLPFTELLNRRFEGQSRVFDLKVFRLIILKTISL